MKSKSVNRKLSMNKCFLSGIMLIIRGISMGQEMPSLLPNTPEASSLIQNIEYPVSYSTGLPDISIPLHELSVQNIVLPITIRYRPSLFKATEEEGAAGLGWSLSTDIQITRIVNGLDDFRKGMEQQYGDMQYGYYYQEEGRNSVFGNLPIEKREYMKALHEHYRGNIDIQPDCFYYSLLSGKAGKFYFQKNSNGTLRIVQVPYTGVKIELTTAPVNTTSGQRGSFKITDLDGTEYIYEGDDAEINTGHLNPGYGGFSTDYANNLSGYISSWKCSRIVSANKKETITFFYGQGKDTYTISGRDYMELYYDRACFFQPYVAAHQPSPTEILNAIKFADGYCNEGLDVSMFGNNTHEVAICHDQMNQVQDFQNKANAEYWSVNWSPVAYLKHSTGKGSAVVVPVGSPFQWSTVNDDLVLENKDLRSPVVIRRQERLRIAGIEFPNGQAQFSYGTGGQLSQITVTNLGSLEKQIYLRQSKTGYTNPDISGSETYSPYADGDTYYLDSLIITSGGIRLPYTFSYQNRQGFANYLKPNTTFGEWSYSNPTVLEDFNLQHMALYGVPSPNSPTGTTFVFGSSYMDWDTYHSMVFADNTPELNLVPGSSESGLLYKIGYPTGLTDNFTWEQNKVYAWPANSDAGGMRIKEITSIDRSTMLLRRSFTYGRNENGCGFLKKYIENEYTGSEFNTMIYPLDFYDISQGMTFPSGNSIMLKNYYEDANHYTLKEIYNTNYTGPDGVGFQTRLDRIMGILFISDTNPWLATSDPRWEYNYERLIDSKERTFYANNAYNMPYFYSCPVYYDVVTEYRGGTLMDAGKTVYQFNTEALPYLNFGIRKEANGIYSPPCEWAYGHLVSQIDYKKEYIGDDGLDLVYKPVRSVRNSYHFKQNDWVRLDMRYFENKTNAKKNAALYRCCVEDGYVPNFFIPQTGGQDFSGFAVIDTSITTMYYGNDSLVTTDYYTYDEELLMIEKDVTQSSNGTTLKTENQYSNKLCSILENQGRRNSLITKRTYVDDILQTTENYVYNIWPNNLVALQKAQYAIRNNSLIDKTVYWGYNENGKPTDIEQKLGKHDAYIWAYNKQFPVVVGENISSGVLKSAVEAAAGTANLETFWTGFNSITTNSSQQADWEVFNASLRNNASFTNAQIMTYTYSPLIGMTSQTDPNGVTTYYEYDDLGRLKTAKDDDGNIIKQYDYHYSNQN